MGLQLHWFPEDVTVSRLATTMVGMANSEGGLVVLGVAPRAREVHGISLVEEVQDRIFQASLQADPPLVLPLPVLALSIFTSMLQAFVFVILSIVYISDFTAHGEDHAHAHD